MIKYYVSIKTFSAPLIKFFLAAFATFTAGLLSLLAFVSLGMLLPMWLMIAIHGIEKVQGAPAHGGVILFATVPFAAVLSAVGFCLFSRLFYQWLSRLLLRS